MPSFRVYVFFLRGRKKDAWGWVIGRSKGATGWNMKYENHQLTTRNRFLAIAIIRSWWNGLSQEVVGTFTAHLDEACSGARWAAISFYIIYGFFLIIIKPPKLATEPCNQSCVGLELHLNYSWPCSEIITLHLACVLETPPVCLLLGENLQIH